MPYDPNAMDTYGPIVYFACIFGGAALIVVGALWAARHPRSKGEPLSRARKAWMVLAGLGSALIIAAVLSL